MLFGGLLALGGLLAFSFIFHQNPDSSQTYQRIEQEVSAASVIPEGGVRRLTDGIFIPEEEQPDRFFAVMIENSAEAWPLSGLADARLVFEAPVEGSIPRFMAVYDNKQTTEKIGPVRSARPYYVDWAAGLGVMYAHVGGSPQALSMLNAFIVPSLNEFYFGSFFWRSSDRYAPHNVYTSIENLDQAFAHRKFDQQTFPVFSYMDEPDTREPEVASVDIPFSGPSNLYLARWVYDKSKNVFIRHQGQEQQFDADQRAVEAANVFVLYTDIQVIDEESRRSVRTSGKGKASLFRFGRQFEVEWEKASQSSPLLFATEDGQPVALAPGATWIEVVPEGTQITIHNQQ